MTKKSRRSKKRIEKAKKEKEGRFRSFLLRAAIRRLTPKDQRELRTNFHCLTESLRMPRDEFMSKGQQLAGGAGVLFGRGELAKLLPHSTCQQLRKPTLVMAAYIQEYYDENGRYRGSGFISSTTSGNSTIAW